MHACVRLAHGLRAGDRTATERWAPWVSGPPGPFRLAAIFAATAIARCRRPVGVEYFGLSGGVGRREGEAGRDRFSGAWIGPAVVPGHVGLLSWIRSAPLARVRGRRGLLMHEPPRDDPGV